MRRLLISLAATLFLAPSAHAVDGVLEINQACASVGCFSGDDPGFPVTIDGAAGRSYRLTSNLGVSNVFTHGIFVKQGANDVSIDLNGFAIGRASCLDGEVCSATKDGGGRGIGVETPLVDAPRGLSVRNGSVMWMPVGIYAGYGSSITNVRALWNGYYGIYAHTGSIVTNCTASENLDIGILAGKGSTVVGNTVAENGSHGIWVREGSTVEGNASYRNQTGLLADRDGVILRNGVRESIGIGIDSNSGYGGNVSSGNGGTAIQGGVSLGRNVCDGGVC